MLLAGGLLCLAGFFLPYLSLSFLNTTLASVSGLNMAENMVSAAQRMDAAPSPVMNMLADEWEAAEGFMDLGKIVGFLTLFIAPFIFALYGLSYTFKALLGKSYRGGVFFNILFAIAAGLFFYFVGPELGLGKNFFRLTGLGYWLPFAGMWLAAFSLIFSQNLNSSKA